MIPKTLYLWWGGKKLSWLRYLTVVSFAKYNPDWEIKVYYPTNPTTSVDWTTDEQTVNYTGRDYFDRLTKYAELVPFDMTDIGFSNDATEVHKSDIFRLWVLSNYGGLYSDFDILYTKPLPDISKKKQIYCKTSHGHYAIGFLACVAGDSTFKSLFELTRLTSAGKYQSFGSTMWGRALEEVKMIGWNIPESLVYPYSWEQIDGLFNESRKIPKSSVGIHWYGGSITAGGWENRLTPKTYRKHISTVCDIIKDVL